jgi:hypothetical protein
VKKWRVSLVLSSRRQVDALLRGIESTSLALAATDVRIEKWDKRVLVHAEVKRWSGGQWANWRWASEGGWRCSPGRAEGLRPSRDAGWPDPDDDRYVIPPGSIRPLAAQR